MAAKSTPDGFKVVDYEGHDLFVCNNCRPQFDTWDKDDAQRHADAGVHRTPGGGPIPEDQGAVG